MTDRLPSREDYSHLSPTGQRLVTRFRAAALKHIMSPAPASVLEVGCGQGWFLASVAEALPDASLAGLDIREDAIALANDTDYGLNASVWGTDLAVADTDGDGTFDTAVDDEGNVSVGDFGSVDGGDAV